LFANYTISIFLSLFCRRRFVLLISIARCAESQLQKGKEKKKKNRQVVDPLGHKMKKRHKKILTLSSHEVKKRAAAAAAAPGVVRVQTLIHYFWRVQKGRMKNRCNDFQVVVVVVVI